MSGCSACTCHPAWVLHAGSGDLTGSSLLTGHYAYLVERRGRQGRPLSPTTVRLFHRIVHKALADAVDEDLLTANPAAKAKAPRRHKPETAVWTAGQVRRFLAARSQDRMYAAWLLALTSGLRRGELGGLVWADLDLAGGTLSVARQRTTDADSRVVVKVESRRVCWRLRPGPSAFIPNYGWFCRKGEAPAAALASLRALAALHGGDQHQGLTC